TLSIDGAVRVTLAERTFRLPHCIAGAAELVEIITLITLLAGIEAAPLHILEQFLQLVTQRLLVLTQLAHLVALLSALALLALLTTLAALPTLILTLLEGPIAQLLLLAQHFAKIIEHGHHIVVHVAIHALAGTSHLQILQHLLKLIEQLPSCILRA